MGGAESKRKEAEILQLFSAEERQNIHKLFHHISPNQSITEPFLKVFIMVIILTVNLSHLPILVFTDYRQLFEYLAS